jgi:hypothetical protein
MAQIAIPLVIAGALYLMSNDKKEKFSNPLVLEELENLYTEHDNRHIIENRANNIITSAINLIEMINKHYPEEQAQILERKLLSSIKSKDQQRFAKTLRKKS